ncbi:hypothetical protein BC835DRAFT_1373474, partial [Cytidiella melzeri]
AICHPDIVALYEEPWLVMATHIARSSAVLLSEFLPAVTARPPRYLPCYAFAHALPFFGHLTIQLAQQNNKIMRGCYRPKNSDLRPQRTVEHLFSMDHCCDPAAVQKSKCRWPICFGHCCDASRSFLARPPCLSFAKNLKLKIHKCQSHSMTSRCAPRRYSTKAYKEVHPTQYQQLDLMSITTAANTASTASKASSATHADIDPFPSFSTALANFNKLAMQTQHLLGEPKKNLCY